MPYILNVTLNERQFCEDLHFRVEVGDIVRFNPGASLLQKNVVLYTNYPPTGANYMRETFWKLKWTNRDGTLVPINNGCTHVTHLEIQYEFVAVQSGNFKFKICFAQNGIEQASVYVRIDPKPVAEGSRNAATAAAQKRPASEPPATQSPTKIIRVQPVCACQRRGNSIDLTNTQCQPAQTVRQAYIDFIYQFTPRAFFAYDQNTPPVMNAKNVHDKENCPNRHPPQSSQIVRVPAPPPTQVPLQPIPCTPATPQSEPPVSPDCEPFINRRGQLVLPDGTVLESLNAGPVLGKTIVFDPPDSPPPKPLSPHQRLMNELDDANRPVKIRLLWNQAEELHVHPNQVPFDRLVQKLAERENCSPSLIVLMLGDQVIHPSETPASIKYHVTKVITGRIVYDLANSPKKIRQRNVIKVKIQAETLKRAVQIKIDKTQPFTAMLQQCADTLNTDHTRIKLRFDGEIIDPEMTPMQLELTGGEVIDCIVTK